MVIRSCYCTGIPPRLIFGATYCRTCKHEAAASPLIRVTGKVAGSR